MKILHISDVMLDTAFAEAGLPPGLGDQRRADLRARFATVTDLAREHAVTALTVGGSLFDARTVTPDTLDFIAEQCATLAPLPVLIAPGAADPFTHESPYTLWDWPDNVHVFRQPSLQPVEVSAGVFIRGAAHPIAAGYPLLQGLKLDRAALNLALFDNSGSAHRSEVAFSDAGFDFALLGGRMTAQFDSADAPQYAYPGSLERLTADDADGEHGALLLTITPESRSLDLIETAAWHYETHRVDVTSFSSVREVGTHLAEKMTDDAGVVASVELTGQPEFALDLDDLAASVPTTAAAQYRKQLDLTYDLERLGNEPTVRGEFVRRLRARLDAASDDTTRTQLHNALYFALRALDGHRDVTHAIDAD